jgi:hypothetical protein
MNEPDSDGVANTVQLYLTTRQRFWRGLRGFLACMGIAVLLSWVVKPWNETLANKLPVLLIIPGMIFGIMGFIASFQLLLIRCPRCGNRFGLSHHSSLTYEQCNHCLFVLKCIPENPKDEVNAGRGRSG